MQVLLQNADAIQKRFVRPGAFLVAGTGDDANPMTIGWGYVGYSWGKKTCAVMVRDSRYTQQFMDAHKEFTISFPKKGMEDELLKAGTLSGKDGEKWKRCNIEPASAKSVQVPIVKMQNGIVMECKTLMSTDMKSGFVDEKVLGKWYKDSDMHKLYFGEILEIYEV